jgi:hypothetical protein
LAEHEDKQGQSFFSRRFIAKITLTLFVFVRIEGRRLWSVRKKAGWGAPSLIFAMNPAIKKL